MRKYFSRISVLSLLAISIFIPIFIGCDNPVQNSRSPELSGSLFVKMNGDFKKYSRITIYGDSELTKWIGSTLVFNSSGNQGINDYPITTTLQDNGKWKAIMDLFNMKGTPVTKIWIKVESCTVGSENIIIPYPINLDNNSKEWIDLGTVEIPGTKLNINIGNNFTLNELPANITHINIMRGHDTLARFYVSNNNSYSFETGIINNADNIHIITVGENGINTGQNYNDVINITGAALKAGYTVNNITLDNSMQP